MMMSLNGPLGRFPIIKGTQFKHVPPNDGFQNDAPRAARA
jgi:hypothetical protein